MAKSIPLVSYSHFTSSFWKSSCLLFPRKATLLFSQHLHNILPCKESHLSKYCCTPSGWFYITRRTFHAVNNKNLFSRHVFRNERRHFRTGRNSQGREPWMISSEEVNNIIRKKESGEKLQCGIIERFEANELSSNKPIEDRKFVAKCIHLDNAYIFSVLDGHGGPHAAHCVSQRLANYIAVSMLPREVLLSHSSELPTLTESLVKQYHKMHNYANDPNCLVSLQRFYDGIRNFRKRELPSGKVTIGNFLRRHEFHSGYGESYHINEEHSLNLSKGMTQAFLRLDTDIGIESLPCGEDSFVCENAFNAVASGACAVVAFLQDNELCIANVGDCRAVLGVQEKNGSWSAVPLSTDHTASNPAEVQRVFKQHPPDEAPSIIRNGRLLGSLTPLRAFGDMRFKWDKKIQNQVFGSMGKANFAGLKEYLTPPYLTAEPEVATYQLRSSDKFLILATDGLWDAITNEEAVFLVHEHEINKKRALATQKEMSVTYDEPCTLKMDNAASCLIREALGGSDDITVSTVLNIPHPDRRNYRDDITVMVIFFDWEQ